MMVAVIIYLIFLLIYSFFSAIFFYHLNEFGNIGDACSPMKVAYLVASSIIIIFTIISLIIAGGFYA